MFNSIGYKLNDFNKKELTDCYKKYGFEELIEKVNEIIENTKKNEFNAYCVENNINKQIPEKFKVDYSIYGVLLIVTLVIFFIVALFTYSIMSFSIETGAVNVTSAVVSIEYNDGSQIIAQAD